MATYKELKGTNVPFLSSDPTLVSDMEGDIWFNSSENKLKGLVGISAWSSSSNMNDGRKGGHFSFGTGTAAIAAGGTPPTAGQSEEYNGSGWVSLPTINDVRYGGAGAGTTTAGLIFGSASPTPLAIATETWNGSAWTSVNQLNTGHGNAAGGGLQNAAWVAGGGPSLNQVTEEFDGTNWAAGGSMTGTARYGWFGSGPQTASIAGGGQYPPGTQFDGTEEYDGTSWAAGGTISDSRGWAGSSGDSSNDIIFGGNPGSGTYTTGDTEEYNGSTWSTLAETLGDARNDAYSAGTTTASAMTSGGEPVPIEATTENWSTSIYTVGAAAWAAGGSPANGRQWASGAGTATAGLTFGGVPRASATPVVEEYDGGTWTAGGAYPVTYMQASGGGGTQTAAVGFGGWTNTPPYVVSSTNLYDGSTWSASPAAMGAARYAIASAGTQTAALMSGGRDASTDDLDNCEEFNGTTWSTQNVINTGRKFASGGPQGSQTSAVIAGGRISSAGSTATETYDGTTWTTSGAVTLEAARGQGASNPSGNTPMLFAGGGDPASNSLVCQDFDGSVWATSPSLGTANAFAASFGTSATLVISGGRNPSNLYQAVCEEFTGVVETITASVISSS